jgi:RNA polymerase sigma-70 factor (ECF subfamily)
VGAKVQNPAKVVGYLGNLIYLPEVNKRLSNTSIPEHEEGSGASDAAAGERTLARTKQRAARAQARSEDLNLVERARQGDQGAFRELFQRYHRRAYSLAFGVVRNQDDALDVVQDAFIKAHRHLEKFEGNSSFYTWFYRIVMNLSIDHIRKHKRSKHVDFNDALSHEEGDAGASDDALLPRILGQNPGKALMRREIREQITVALAELSDNHRAVLVMRELEGLSYEEMAEVMQCSKGTIMSRLFHARKNMQKRLLEFMGGQKDLGA